MAVISRRFTHDPYHVRVLPDTPRSVSPGPQSVSDACLPGTLHTDLQGVVNFVPYPTKSDAVPLLIPTMAKCNMTRLFVGQLPYGTTMEQLQWTVYEASHCGVFYTETIHNWTGDKHSKGCVHTYCDPAQADYILKRLHRHVLIDDTGVWIAETDEEYAALEGYCAKMKLDKTKRFHQRPCQPVVAQRATSTFVPQPRHPPAAQAQPPVYVEQHQHVPVLPLYHEAIGAMCLQTPPPPSYKKSFVPLVMIE